MEIILIDKNDNNTICRFVEGLNKANVSRSSERIPYKKNQVIDMIKRIEQDNVFLYCMKTDNDRVLGGACCTYKKNTNISIGVISHVWVHPDEQRKGIAESIIRYIENHAVSLNIQLLRLNVANIYIPAVSLYKKLGFLPLKIYANVPRTYHFIRMIKPIDGYIFPEPQRCMILFLSRIKFNILFKKDSTPRWVHKIIYGKK